MARLVPELEEIRYRQGDILFNKGDQGDSLMIVTEGEARVFTFNEMGEERDLAVIGRYEYLGEMALLTGASRSASVQARSDLTVLKLSRSRFERLLNQHPALSIHLNRVLSQRLNSSNEEAAGRCSRSGQDAEVDEVETEFIYEPDTDNDNVLPMVSYIGMHLRKAFSIRSELIAALIILVSLGILYGLRRADWTSSQIILVMMLWLAAAGWSTNALSFNVISLALPVVAVLFGVSNTQLAFSGFSSTSWFLVLGVLAMAAAMTNTGLLFRAALWMASKFPPNFANQTFALALTGVLITPIIPSAEGRSTLAGSLALDLIETAGLKGESRGATGIAMACMYGFGQMSFLFMNGSTACLLVLGLLPQNIAGTLSWGLWFKGAIPLAIYYFIFSWVMILFFYHENISFNRATIKKQLYILGPMSLQEIISLGIVLFYLLAVLTQSWHHIDNAWMAMVAFLLLFTTSVIDEKTVRKDIDWNQLISIGALIGFGAIMEESGIIAVAAHIIPGFFMALSNHVLLFLWFIAIAVYLLRFVLPLEPTLVVSTLIFTYIGLLIGVNPFIVALVILIASDPIFLPYQNMIYDSMSTRSDNLLLARKQILKFAYSQFIIILLSVALSVPFWIYMGLL